MKDLNKYFQNSTDGEILSNVISDVINGSLSGDELKFVVDELEKKGLLNSDVTVEEVDSSKWNKSYIDELSFKIHLYSREYFAYLEKVAKHINEREKIHKNAVLKFKMVVGGLLSITIFFLVCIIHNCSK